MKYIDLIGKRLIGFMVIEKQEEINKLLETNNDRNYRLLLFIGDDSNENDILNAKRILLVNDNRDDHWHWYSNWRLIEITDNVVIEINSSYKSIGEIINCIDVDSDNKDILKDSNIDAEMNKWINAVGEGNWGAKENENYYYINIKTNTKILSLGTIYHDCHYPDCIWDFI